MTDELRVLQAVDETVELWGGRFTVSGVDLAQLAAKHAITAYLQATPLREDGATEREIERLQRVVRQQQQRLDDQGHGIQMTQHALTARNARIAELEALLEERDGDGVERPHSSGEPDGAGENPDGPLLVATTTQDSRDE